MFSPKHNPWRLRGACVLFCIAATLLFHSSHSIRDRIQKSIVRPERRAFVTFLEGFDNGNKNATDDEDIYHLATRVLVYQLLYGPDTRTVTSIPFVVMATEDVAQHERARLEKDGATIIVCYTANISACLGCMDSYRSLKILDSERCSSLSLDQKNFTGPGNNDQARPI